MCLQTYVYLYLQQTQNNIIIHLESYLCLSLKSLTKDEDCKLATAWNPVYTYLNVHNVYMYRPCQINY